jgi:hypothetical protein
LLCFLLPQLSSVAIYFNDSNFQKESISNHYTYSTMSTATNTNPSPLTALLEMATTSQNAATLRTVILKALSDSTIFSGFDELSAVCSPILQDSIEGTALLATLRLFSYGTIQDYTTAAPGTYVSLSEGALYKLGQLTVLNAVQQACWQHQAVVSYANMPTEESMIVSCIYAGLFQGQLCQISQTLTLDPSAPIISRDVARPKDAIVALREFMERLDDQSSSLERSKSTVLALQHQRQATAATASKARVAGRSMIGNALIQASAAGQKSNKRTRGDTKAAVGRF